MSHLAGARLALHWLTTFPIHQDGTDARTRGLAITWAPVVGVLLGGVVATLLYLLSLAGLPPLMSGLLAVGATALLTRGMHLDGLADTADGLGCYGPSERALAVMKDGGVGAFATVALVITIGVQAVALGALGGTARWPAVVYALVAGRAAFSWCCRRGVPPARPEGFGALVAGTQHPAVPAAWLAALVCAGPLVVPGRPWLGPLAALLAAGAVALLTRHLVRRFGGVTGDVFGANAEVATTVVLVVCAAV
ncbi:adenosylcobinamide-GDP ribazoletransferase [Actinokineospora auranticolor]|uniref:Adenosylcobinamide-GDP ribazoletransferase n=1 Tax=Actinokineospora auranticolor TaxID=155976 RepID=A0A2S6GD81_9PSEU|nr:adenosylcobinamide-GDP ribazoletransferase [Actinokineospora auranticolor]PPK63071.1 adenosylcobinamide-GDP ribazoletransferase [Actinokineospora auranticolor]